MKYSTLFVGALFLFVGCSDVSGVSEPLTPEDLILGSWQVSAATIDGEVYPVTIPGLGQIEAIFHESGVEYIYPGVNANGIPTGETDTLTGEWHFNEDHSMLYITNISEGFSSDMEWSVIRIGVGLLQTTYNGPSITNPNTTVTYDITYQLTE